MKALLLLVLAASSSATWEVRANMRCSSTPEGVEYDCDPVPDAGAVDFAGNPVVPMRTTVETDGGFILTTITPESV